MNTLSGQVFRVTKETFKNDRTPVGDRRHFHRTPGQICGNLQQVSEYLDCDSVRSDCDSVRSDCDSVRSDCGSVRSDCGSVHCSDCGPIHCPLLRSCCSFVPVFIFIFQVLLFSNIKTQVL